MASFPHGKKEAHLFFQASPGELERAWKKKKRNASFRSCVLYIPITKYFIYFVFVLPCVWCSTSFWDAHSFHVAGSAGQKFS
jgi:hypothetical protein